ncbi:c-type cytochrome [Limnobacter parvus]|uniref:C-type cytochrome n=1 Tax=Limnobacter parvus TaxID=2939690 RepID=A0ABT1XKH5_9BURK|nr:c-type cytochrome [Limnobacter parvus]MCR2746777.1 c-type cytochrome [Limnobacter parvus]
MRQPLKMLIAVCTGLLFGGSALAFEGLGRVATPAEVTAWDIDVRPDFVGLPKGSGSVQKGMEVWDAQCASCHGVFGESNEIFTPIVGGTSVTDIQTGRVQSLKDGSSPQRTTLMKVPTLSTLWDYINRAMPWNAPKSLSTEEVYAVTAYILNMGGVVGDDFVLSHTNMAATQARLPNRNGMQTNHGMWLPSGKPDVKETRCMSNCTPDAKVISFMPDYAKDAHGNLKDQNRLVGPVRGVVTVAQAGTEPSAPKVSMNSGESLFNANGCVACHGVDNKKLGPSVVAIANKYKDKADARAYLAQRIKAGSSGVWGDMPMPAQSHLSDEDLNALSDWFLSKRK